MEKLFDLFPAELKKQAVEFRRTAGPQKPQAPKKAVTTKTDYAYERARKLPLLTARNVLSAMQHFLNVAGVTDQDRHTAYRKIVKKAEEFNLCTISISKQYEAWKVASASVSGVQ